MMSTTTNFLQRDYWFGQVDSRPLGLFRIAFATLLVKNALYLIPLTHLFFSDDGIVPRAQFWDDPTQVGLGQFSILNYVATSWLASLIFLVWAAIALALLVGYRTRLMTVLNYLLWLALIQRNFFVLHAPDHVMTVLSFWIIFLPLNQHYSLDGWLARRRYPPHARGDCLPLPRTTYAFPLRTIQIQIALIYLLTSYYKWQSPFWRTGDAIFYTLQQEGFLLPSGLWLGATAPLWLIHLLTWFTLLIETSFVPFVFAPVLQPWAKATGLILAGLLHLGIALTMAIPDFSIVMWISYLLFFEPGWVAWLEEQVRRLLRLSPALRLPPTPLTQRPARHSLLRMIGHRSLTFLMVILLLVAIGAGFGPRKGLWDRLAALQPRFVGMLNDQLHLASPWSMFAYSTVPRSGWLLIAGQFENGGQRLLYSSVDSSSGRMNWTWGPGARLRFFEQRLLSSFPETILRAWSDYYCHLYNRQQTRPTQGQLMVVEIHRHYRWAHTPGAPPNPYEDDLLWRHQCLGSYSSLKVYELRKKSHFVSYFLSSFL